MPQKRYAFLLRAVYWAAVAGLVSGLIRDCLRPPPDPGPGPGFVALILHCDGTVAPESYSPPCSKEGGKRNGL